MRILYHEHARQRMAQRNITEEQVEDTLNNYDTTVPADKDRTKYIKHSGEDEVLAVVAVIRKVSDTHFVVYTVFRERGKRA